MPDSPDQNNSMNPEIKTSPQSPARRSLLQAAVIAGVTSLAGIKGVEHLANLFNPQPPAPISESPSLMPTKETKIISDNEIRERIKLFISGYPNQEALEIAILQHVKALQTNSPEMTRYQNINQMSQDAYTTSELTVDDVTARFLVAVAATKSHWWSPIADQQVDIIIKEKRLDPTKFRDPQVRRAVYFQYNQNLLARLNINDTGIQMLSFRDGSGSVINALQTMQQQAIHPKNLAEFVSAGYRQPSSQLADPQTTYHELVAIAASFE